MTASLRLGTIIRLARRDLLHGWQSTACLVVAVAVALIPLLLLYGLKFGVVTSLIDTLRSDPRILELKLVEDTELDQAWFDALQQDERVGFVLPRARYLATSVRLRGPESRSILEPRMIPTAPGDPLLAGLQLPQSWFEAVITERVQIESGAGVGDEVELIIMRLVGDERQAVRHLVTVSDVLPRDLLQTNDIFVQRDLEAAVERYREGFSVDQLGWPAATEDRSTDAENRSFASFRLYARDIRDVPGLRDDLLAEGYDVETRAEEIETTLAIEQGLGWVFLVISSLSAAGFLLTLGLHLAATVVEKARELAILRLLGLSGLELALLPSLQGAMIGFGGAVTSCLLTGLAQPVVNNSLSGLAGLQGQVSQLTAGHFFVAILAATLAGAAAGSVAGHRSAKLEPTQGLRHD